MNNNINSNTNNASNLNNINQNSVNIPNNNSINTTSNIASTNIPNNINIPNNTNVANGQVVTSNNSTQANIPANNSSTNNQVNLVNSNISNQNPNININPNNASLSNEATKTISSPNQTINNSNPITNPSNSTNIKIEETSVTKSQKGTVAVATINNGNVNILTEKMPESIDINVKENKIVNKNGKKVRIMTKRELITNIILSVFLILVLCGGGYGVYYYMFGNNPRNFETKNITVEYGEEIPASVRSYINLTDISEPDYTLDLSKVKEEIGTYQYTVSYGKTTKTGTITINDTKAPIVTFKENKEFDEGTIITKDMLVEKCEDISGCTYELTNEVDTKNPGTINASVTAKDNLGNAAEYTVDLNIVEKLTTLVCSSTVVTTDENSKTLLESNTYTLEFNNQKVLKNGTLKVLRTYLSDSDYISIKNNLVSEGYTLEEVNRRANKESSIDNVANLTSQEDIKAHLESNTYTCNIKED